ncbi:MAG: hypothetical protein GY806_14205 [Gammaproteobacteria bacterium]|nr:hypothetical protein [Gammaproteobacteria bacterium]
MSHEAYIIIQQTRQSKYSATSAPWKHGSTNVLSQERFVSKDCFPATEGKNQSGYQLWITPFAVSALNVIDNRQIKFEIERKVASLS